jgi:hypothetical protein
MRPFPFGLGTSNGGLLLGFIADALPVTTGGVVLHGHYSQSLSRIVPSIGSIA